MGREDAKTLKQVIALDHAYKTIRHTTKELCRKVLEGLHDVLHKIHKHEMKCLETTEDPSIPPRADMDENMIALQNQVDALQATVAAIRPEKAEDQLANLLKTEGSTKQNYEVPKLSLEDQVAADAKTNAADLPASPKRQLTLAEAWHRTQ